MKILYFNWVPTRAFNKDGGGVSLYQKNLLMELSKKSNLEIYYLTVSYVYDYFSFAPYIRKVNSCTIPNIHEFELVNSPILAPSFFSFNIIDYYFKRDKSIEKISMFLKKEKFDVIHFNNLEGISAEVLSLKKENTSTKFVLSLHNYFPFCAQVNLWYRDSENCVDFNNGIKCSNCNIFPVDRERIRFERSNLALKKHTTLNKIISKIYGKIYPFKGVKNKLTHEDRRKKFVNLINENVDEVLAVSQRVKLIAIKMGIDKEKVSVQYIGTRHAEYANQYKNIMKHNGYLTLGYLGYMRRDKGFYFLLEALKKIPENMAKRISLIIAAPITDKNAYDELMSMRNKYRDINMYDGYKQDSLRELIKTVNLGIVPVLWEDNLPQVALEFVAYGKPIFTSDLGGAQEITRSKKFVFKAGSTDDFISKLNYLLDNNDSLGDFWKDASNKPILNTVQHHCNILLQNVYK